MVGGEWPLEKNESAGEKMKKGDIKDRRKCHKNGITRLGTPLLFRTIPTLKANGP